MCLDALGNAVQVHHRQKIIVLMHTDSAKLEDFSPNFFQ